MKLTAYQRLKEFYSEFPQATDQEAIHSLGISQATFYRAKKELRRTITEKTVQEFELPAGVKMKILPPKKYPYTHLAAYLAKFRMGDKVPPYNKTKAEIMFLIKEYLENNPTEAADLVFSIQEGLAKYAIYNGDVSAFAGALGKLEIPREIEF